ncbi:unnamed protein product [Closterium sp. NIES-65]|nr:unnamed protein product [Closterium sp. NIES-65]
MPNALADAPHESVEAAQAGGVIITRGSKAIGAQTRAGGKEGEASRGREAEVTVTSGRGRHAGLFGRFHSFLASPAPVVFHPQVPFVFGPRVVLAALISLVGAALANAGGVGGGGLFVPMFNLLLGYDAKTSTALSKSMIMGGALASVCFNVQLKHPTFHQPLIDYGLARLMQPTLLLGISVGVTCNVIFPPWLITVMLFLLLLLITYKALDKGVAMWMKESHAACIAPHRAHSLTHPILPPFTALNPTQPRAVMTYKTLDKGVAMWMKESQVAHQHSAVRATPLPSFSDSSPPRPIIPLLLPSDRTTSLPSSCLYLRRPLLLIFLSSPLPASLPPAPPRPIIPRLLPSDRTTSLPSSWSDVLRLSTSLHARSHAHSVRALFDCESVGEPADSSLHGAVEYQGLARHGLAWEGQARDGLAREEGVFGFGSETHYAGRPGVGISPDDTDSAGGLSPRGGAGGSYSRGSGSAGRMVGGGFGLSAALAAASAVAAGLEDNDDDDGFGGGFGAGDSAAGSGFFSGGINGGVRLDVPGQGVEDGESGGVERGGEEGRKEKKEKKGQRRAGTREEVRGGDGERPQQEVFESTQKSPHHTGGEEGRKEKKKEKKREEVRGREGERPQQEASYPSAVSAPSGVDSASDSESQVHSKVAAASGGLTTPLLQPEASGAGAGGGGGGEAGGGGGGGGRGGGGGGRGSTSQGSAVRTKSLMEELHFGAPLEASLFQLVDWRSVMELLLVWLVASLFQLVDWRSVLELLLVWAAFLALQLAKQHTPDCSRPYWLLNASLFQLVDWRSVMELLLVWAAFLALQLAKQHTPDCSRPYWLLNALQIPVALLATLVGAFRLYRQSHPSPRRNSRGRGGAAAAGTAGGGAAAGVEASEQQQQQRDGGSSSRGEYHTAHWGMQQLWGYPLCSFIAGVMGGLLGIGGGMVMGPVLLELNLPPQVTAATSTFMVVFSSSLSVLEFYLLGRIPIEVTAATTTFMVVFSSSLSVLEFYLLGRIPIEVALVFAGIAMVAAFSGLSIVRAIVMRYGKPSVIIFALGSVIGLSGIVLGAYGGVNTYHDWMAGANMGFRDLCAREF